MSRAGKNSSTRIISPQKVAKASLPWFFGSQRAIT